MILSRTQIEKLKNISVIAAKAAGDIILKYKKEGFDIYKKDSGHSPASQVLTNVDLLCQSKILELLSPYIKKFDLGLLTEEEVDNKSRFEKEYFFSIDPMDGTKSFVESSFGFSVSISLVTQKGESVLGVVYDPVKDNLYCAIRGVGVFKNGLHWIPKIRSNDKLKIIVDSSYNKESIKDVDFIEYGGAVLNAIEVLEGRADCYIKKPKIESGGGSIWDFSSTVALFNECGSIAEDIYGKPINLNNPESTFMNKTGVVFCHNKIIQHKILYLLNINQTQI